MSNFKESSGLPFQGGKMSTSGGTPKIPDGISGNFVIHLISHQIVSISAVYHYWNTNYRTFTFQLKIVTHLKVLRNVS